MLYGQRPLTLREIDKILSIITPRKAFSAPRAINTKPVVNGLGSSTYSSRWDNRSEAAYGWLEAYGDIVNERKITFSPDVVKAMADPVYGGSIKAAQLGALRYGVI